eukprot:9368233-Pyramimonas_sp.AAC.1
MGAIWRSRKGEESRSMTATKTRAERQGGTGVEGEAEPLKTKSNKKNRQEGPRCPSSTCASTGGLRPILPPCLRCWSETSWIHARVFRAASG